MRFIINSTFLINTINTDIGLIDDLKLNTIKDVIDETGYETGIDIGHMAAIQTIPSERKIKSLKVPSSKQKMLSATDMKLLNVAFKNKRSAALVTDDRQLRVVAKNNRIRCYTTPLFVAYLIRNDMIGKEQGMAFLLKLKYTYIRPKDIDLVMKHIRKWR